MGRIEARDGGADAVLAHWLLATCPIRSSIAGRIQADSLNRQIIRAGINNAVAMASSV